MTGATGFVGKWLVNKLLSENNEVTVIARNINKIEPEWKTNNNCNVVICDIKDLMSLDCESIGDTDCFFHFAWDGTSGPKRFDETLQLSNVQHTCDAVKLAKKLNAKRFVFAGSIMEFEAINFVGADGATPAPANIYSTAKLTADYMAKIYCTDLKIDYINAVISNIYGVGEVSARFVNTMLKRMDDAQTIPLSKGTQTYDFIYIEDAVEIIYLAALNGTANNSYYIGNSSQRPLKEYVKEMNEIVGKNAVLDFGAFDSNNNFLSYKEFDTSKAERELGFVPKYTFSEGIKITLEWIRSVNGHS